MVESEDIISLLHNILVRTFEVLGEDNISVVSDGLHPSLLADSGNLGSTDLVRTSNICRMKKTN